MKLDVRSFRYLTPEDWRVLTAFEMGSKNHEVVPTALATQLSGLHNGTGGVGRCISTLAKAGLIAKVKNTSYDGYRLTFGGYDYLALHSHTRSSAIVQLGSTMGVGKESDIWLVTSPSPLSGAPVQSILKIHRLGRISFRTASTKRSYQGRREHASWQFLSRLSAQKEFQAMTMLRDAGFRTPRPIAWNRHTIVMSLVPGTPLRNVPLVAFGKSKREQEKNVAALYSALMELLLKMAEFGLIHGDINEFNLLIEGVPEDMYEDQEEPSLEEPPLEEPQHTEQLPEEDATAAAEAESKLIPHLIDFPQITSMSHPEAEEFFDRDVRGVKDFFRKRYHFEASDMGPSFADALARQGKAVAQGVRKLDIEMEAAGYNKKASRELDEYYNKQRADDGTSPEDDLPETNADVPEDGNEEESQEARQEGDVDLGQAATNSADFQDLLKGIEEMKVAAVEQKEKPRVRTKAAAGWAI